MNYQFASKSYYKNIIISGLIRQCEIPSEYLLDSDIINLMTINRWYIMNINPNSTWTTIIKSSGGLN